jgi:hypothetical protein
MDDRVSVLSKDRLLIRLVRRTDPDAEELSLVSNDGRWDELIFFSILGGWLSEEVEDMVVERDGMDS